VSRRLDPKRVANSKALAVDDPRRGEKLGGGKPTLRASLKGFHERCEPSGLDSRIRIQEEVVIRGDALKSEVDRASPTRIAIQLDNTKLAGLPTKEGPRPISAVVVDDGDSVVGIVRVPRQTVEALAQILFRVPADDDYLDVGSRQATARYHMGGQATFTTRTSTLPRDRRLAHDAKRRALTRKQAG